MGVLNVGSNRRRNRIHRLLRFVSSRYRRVLIDLQGPDLRCTLLRYRKSKVTERKDHSRMGVTARRESAESAPAEVLSSARPRLHIPLPPMVHTGSSLDSQS